MDVNESFRLSALSKSKYINQYVKNTTIGPNRSPLIIEETVRNETKVDEPRTSILLEHNYVATNASSVIQKFIFELENIRQEKVQDAVNLRIKQISDFSKQQTLITQQQITRHQQLLMHEIQEKEVVILRTLEQHDKDTLEQHQQLLKFYKILEDKRKENNKQLEQEKKRRQKLCALFDEIKQNQIQFCSIYQKIISDIKNCPFSSQLRDHLGDLTQQLKTLPDRLEEIIANCKAKNITETDSIKSSRLVEDIKGLQSLVEEKISIINKEQEAKVKPPPAPVQLNKPDIIRRNSETKATVTSSQVNQFVSTSSLKVFTELQIYLENYKQLFQDLIQNSTLKQFRFNCQKAVNIPVNAISATNKDHFIDKFDRLFYLLAGKRVQVGDDTVCAADHPQGIAFCTHLVAKKFVVQADLTISTNPNAAFCYASIIIALWHNYPEFGKLLLAQFHAQCPYLVPIFLPRTVEQTDQEFYESQGYRYIDGVIEKQDKFLKRQTGIMRLYSAIIIANPRKGQKNPLGIVEGWRWLTCFLNLEPKEDITATLMHIFFEICGAAMCNTYGKTFEKLMEYVCGFYLPKIQKIDKGGPVTRLESILVNYYKTKKFEEPNGVLAVNFW